MRIGEAGRLSNRRESCRDLVHPGRAERRGVQMKMKILEGNGKPAFAILPYEEYRALRELAGDADDAQR